tara:strand:+ start:3024 stop:3530 length:507 start_codon:yes stop_codon:yes gene_type:complete
MDPTPPEPMPEPGPPKHYACSNCDYNLVGVRIGDPCPECGKLFLLSEASQQRVGAAVASLVLGMMSILTCMFYGIPGLICGIVALVYAKKAREAVRLGRAPAFSLDFAKAGKICGWVGICLSALFFVLMAIYIVFVVAMVGAAFTGGGGFPAPAPAPTPVPMPAPVGP